MFEKNVTVLGAAFKPHSDDIRDSPALDVAVQLRGLGATSPSPIPPRSRTPAACTRSSRTSKTATRRIRGADAVVLVTEWDEYRRELAPEHASTLTDGPRRRRRPERPGRRRLARRRLDLLRHGQALTLV